ncbi:MAG: hypothetical protein LUE93_11005 [Bacteroides sp.]|nr:hypothetical protein [Bacteroides sp.]
MGGLAACTENDIVGNGIGTLNVDVQLGKIAVESNAVLLHVQFLLMTNS